MTDTSRRAFLASAGGTLAAAWIATDVANLLSAGRYAAWAGRQSPPPAFDYLSAEDAADIEAAAAQIIPSDDTPGAREARVVYFVDKALATWQKDQRGDFRTGVAELRRRARAIRPGTKFASLGGDQQHAILAAMERERHPFFETIRGATIVGMLANPEYGGNHDKSGWKMIGFVDQFSWAPPFGWYDANAR